jgi:xanthine dehydrogenase YagS FAD-binding subunit
MDSFRYVRAKDESQAITFARRAKTAQQGADIRYIAGGTTLVDLMKLDVERPQTLIDITHLPLTEIEAAPGGGVEIGAMVRNSDLAHHPLVQRDYPVLSEALLSGASAQLRNKATTSGNLLQRTRCMYFRDVAMPCNKREPGSGCGAITGINRTMAILGGSEHCVATNPSDMNVALVALEAVVRIHGAAGSRDIPIADFHLPPGATPQRETVLQPGDLVTHIVLPAAAPGSRSTYLKLRDRASYEFALTSAAVVATVESGRIQRVRIAMGGVGTKPWRFIEAERRLTGMPATPDSYQQIAASALKDARPLSQNGFKVALAQRCLVHALRQATETV